MKRHPRIVLTGFMGSGKSTVARAICELLSCEVIDLDEQVTVETGQTPKSIIETDGETAFRDIESRVLRLVLTRGTTSVIALGGGTWTLSINRELIADAKGRTFWLDAPFELCWKRIAEGGAERPLAANEEQSHTLYHQRQRLYALADFRIGVTEQRSLEDIAREICELSPDS
ncbi:MAG TPA: shikimate kinase [Pyrinomonadaceae bacterium]|nr:shikimate kinase [Pyrinomonadaceae bacterium]